MTSLKIYRQYFTSIKRRIISPVVSKPRALDVLYNDKKYFNIYNSSLQDGRISAWLNEAYLLRFLPIDINCGISFEHPFFTFNKLFLINNVSLTSEEIYSHLYIYYHLYIICTWILDIKRYPFSPLISASNLLCLNRLLQTCISLCQMSLYYLFTYSVVLYSAN